MAFSFFLRPGNPNFPHCQTTRLERGFSFFLSLFLSFLFLNFFHFSSNRKSFNGGGDSDVGYFLCFLWSRNCYCHHSLCSFDEKITHFVEHHFIFICFVDFYLPMCVYCNVCCWVPPWWLCWFCLFSPLVFPYFIQCFLLESFLLP